VSRVDITEGAVAANPRRFGRTAGALTLLAVFLLIALLAWRMVPHPIGPARTFDKYEGKAVTTAKAAESEVQAALLVARTASKDNSFGPYTALVIADAEDGIGGLQGSFTSIQPPDQHADAVGHELDQLLGDAVEHTRNLRVAARRGGLHDLAAIAAPLESDARKLESFQERHS
jgi:hypothetical protein